ncbi:hypothetical protein HK405_002401, partial [Cladochytrium tenue]
SCTVRDQEDSRQSQGRNRQRAEGASVSRRGFRPRQRALPQHRNSKRPVAVRDCRACSRRQARRIRSAVR